VELGNYDRIRLSLKETARWRLALYFPDAVSPKLLRHHQNQGDLFFFRNRSCP
jgi:hypothetical protein